MLKIRLQRIGRKHDPSFRIVVTPKETGPKSNKNVEILGHYNPKTKNKFFDAEKIKHWISMGALPSDTVHNMLVAEKIIEGKKKNVLPKKNPIVKEAEEEEKTESPAVEEKVENPEEEKVENPEEEKVEAEEKVENPEEEKNEEPKKMEEKTEETETPEGDKKEEK